MAEASLTQRVRSSFVWTAASTVSAQTMAVLRSVLIARFLGPAQFGLYQMALTVTNGLDVLTNLGLDESVIVSKAANGEELRRHLDTVWTAELIRRAILALLVVLAAWPTAWFYREFRLAGLLGVLSLRWLIEGFQNLGLVLLRRDVQFRRVFLFEQTTLLLYTLFTFVLAWKTRSAWALVFSQILHVVCWVALSYGFHPYRPRFAFDRVRFQQSFQFGKSLLVSGLMTYVTTTADNITVAKYCGKSVLGVYVNAYLLANLPLVAVRDILGRVMFPAYAALSRQSGERLGEAVGRAFGVGCALLMATTVPVAVIANEFIVALYGSAWSAGGPLLRLLILGGLLRGLSQMIASLFNGLNQPHLDARVRVGEAIAFVTLLIPLTARYGAPGAAWAGIGVFAISFFVRFVMARRLLSDGFVRVPGIVVAALFAGIGGFALGLAALSLAESPLLRLALGGAVALVGVSALLLGVMPGLRAEIRAALAAWKSRHAR